MTRQTHTDTLEHQHEMPDAEKLERIAEVVTTYKDRRGALVAVLQEAQNIFGYLSEEVQTVVSEGLEIPLSEVYEVASFYSFFSLKPRGKNIIRCCTGTACYVRGAQSVLDAFAEELHIQPGETTEDKLFTLEACRCLGACGLAPAAIMEVSGHGAQDGRIHGHIRAEGIREIIELYRNPIQKESGIRRSRRIRSFGRKLIRTGQSPRVDDIMICGGTGCVSAGCTNVRDELLNQIEMRGLNGKLRVAITGCFGSCDWGPVMAINPGKIFYRRVKEGDVGEIVKKHVLRGKPVERLLYAKDKLTMDDVPFFKKQNRIVRHNCGSLGVEEIHDYVSAGGFEGLKKALTMSPEQIVSIVRDSGLRGRGGAGFPTGIKWETALRVGEGDSKCRKYVLCNADEGDPGAFMDRSLLESEPYTIIEAMAIAGYAIGAEQGFVHVRAEYPLAVERLATAIEKAREMGYLGEDVLGMGKLEFDVEMRVGAGAFVCGEESALIRNIEGKRASPDPRPPFPAEQGLWGSPTLVNNVETLANIPLILRHGAEWLRSVGTKGSTGTKVFALAGAVNVAGLVEVQMGTTLREIVFEIGGGVPEGKKLKAVQIGGPSGACIPAEHIDTPVDYESLAGLGAIMGSGGLIVLDENTCMVRLARFFMEFIQDESCGKCPPCRLGTKRLLDILTRICEGDGMPEDIETLKDASQKIKDTSLCGLGRTAPNPVLSTLRYFRNEYEYHIAEKRCIAGDCRPALVYHIDPIKCVGCGKCVEVCEVGAIHPKPYSPYVQYPYVIDQEKCTASGDCVDSCPFEAIVAERVGFRIW